MEFRKFLKYAHDHRISIDPKKRYIGIIFILFGWFMLALSRVNFFKVSSNISPFVSFFFTFLPGLLFYSLYWLYKGNKFLKIKQWNLVLLRGILGILTYYTYYFAQSWAKAVDYSILLSTESLFVPIIMGLILRKKYPLITWIGVCTGFIGVGLLATFNVRVFSVAGSFGIASGFGLAIMIIITSYIVYNDPPTRVAFYQLLIGVFLSGIISVFDWQWPSIRDMGIMLYSGLMYGLALFLFLDAFYFTEPHIIAMLGYSLVFFTELIKWISYGTIPTVRTIYGFILILIGGYMVILMSYIKDKKKIHKK